MSRTLQTTLGVFLGLILLLFVGLCSLAMLSGGAVGCTLATGRGVAVTATGLSCSMMNTNDTATIKAAGHRIVVAPKYLQVNGRRVAAIDPKIKSIEVTATRREITFIGDGKKIGGWRR